MDDIKLKLPGFWDDEEAAPVFLLKRGAERRSRLKELIVECLQNVHPRNPTSRVLQKLAQIRRKVFLPMLKEMFTRGEIMRFGKGTKNNPYRYGSLPFTPRALKEFDWGSDG
jgi:hypothetical protein